MSNGQMKQNSELSLWALAIIAVWLLVSYIYGGHFLYKIDWDNRCGTNSDEYLACSNHGRVSEKGFLYMQTAGKFVLSPLWVPVRTLGSILTNDSKVTSRVVR